MTITTMGMDCTKQMENRAWRAAARLLAASLAVLWLLGGVAVAGGGGNVSVTVVGGDLLVEGDAQANRFLVGKTGGGDHEYEVIGESGTTVNGLSFVVLTATGDVHVSTGAGGDNVRIDGNILVNVTLDGGPGNDVLHIGDPHILADLTIDGGPGADLIDVQDTLVEGALNIRAGSGADTVYFFFMSVHGDTLISSGPGADVVDLDGTSIFGGDLRIED